MGVIKKQSIQSTVLTYIGVLIGFLNSAVFLPMLFSPEEVGLLGFLNSLSSIFATIATFGVPLITVKMFPHFRSDENKHNGFFGFIFLVSIIGSILGVAFYFLFKEQLISDNNRALGYALFNVLFCFVFIGTVFFKNFDGYIRMLYNSVFGVAAETFIKLIIFCMVFSYWVMNGFHFDWVIIVYALAITSAGVITFFYSLTTKVSLNLTQFKRHLGEHRKELLTVGMFGALASIGSIIVLEIDRIMVSNMIDLNANGVYSVAFFFGLFVSLPARGLKRIAAVVISDSLKKNDIDNVAKVYQKSCANQFLIAGYLFLGIWFSVDYVFEFMKPEYAEGKYVILFIGLAQVIELATGVNAEIINVSNHYRYNTYFSAILIVLVIALNYLLIPIWGITGAAIASFISMVIVNLFRAVLLFKKMHLQPYTSKNLLNLILFGAVFAVMLVLPTFENPIIGILINGTLITAIYWLPSYFLSLSDDINVSIDNILSKWRRK